MSDSGACPCDDGSDPRVVTNPPGLSQISYQVDDFTGFRRAMLAPLPGERAIGDWRPVPGDLGLQVIEWCAYLAQILVFYNERHASESYLRTATRPGSIASLVALLGYQPGPGIAATGNVAVTRTAARPGEPLVIPAGMPLASVATPGVPSQVFEVTGSAPVSFAGPSSVPVTLPADTGFIANSDGSQSILLAGKVSGVAAGDQLLLVTRTFAGADDDWALITVLAAAPQPDQGTGTVNTLVTFTGGWGPVARPARHSPVRPEPRPVLKELALAPASTAAPTTGASGSAPRAFLSVGSYRWVPRQPEPHQAPAPQVTDYRLLRPRAAAALWNRGSTSASQVVIAADGSSVHLSAAVRGIGPGDVVMFDNGNGTAVALAVVSAVTEDLWTIHYPGAPPPTPPTIVVAHTALALTLSASDAGLLAGVTDPAALTVRYGFKDAGTIIGVPPQILPSLPPVLGVPAAYQPPPGTQTAFLADAAGAGILVGFSAAGTGQITVTSASPIGTPLEVPLRLLLDVVPVSRGRTVTGEVLGSGSAALINQSFTLAKSPLTYLAAGDGSAPVLAVYVDGVQWQQVPSFYGQPASARVFVVSRSPDQSVTTITFGDGISGARLTSGAGNVTASYRYGSGALSPPAGRLTTISAPQPSLASVQNPVAVGGGNDPQSPEDVRASAPASVFTFGRAISALDYQVVAAQAPGVARAVAYWTFDGTAQRATVTVYAGDDDTAVASAQSALDGSDDPNRPVTVLAATPIELSLSCALVIAAGRVVPDVIAAATAAVSSSAGGLFSPARMGIGQRLYRSAIDAALSVPGVLAVHSLTVTASGLELDEVLDPGEGSFFDLPAASVSISAASAG